MLKVLILDNDAVKLQAIKKVLVESCNIQKDGIHEANDINACRNYLRKEVYDLLILDLLVPQLKDDPEDDRENGPKFLSEIYKDPEFNIPRHILGLTEHGNEYKNWKSFYGESGWILVKYSQAGNDWANILRNKISHIKSNMESERNVAINKYDIGIICALTEEYNEMKSAFGNDKWTKESLAGSPFTYHSTSLTTRQGDTYKVIAACANKPGASTTSILSTLIFQNFHVDYLFMVGFSAGFKSKGLKLGDVVVAESVQDYASGKLIDNKDGEIKLLKEINQLPGNAMLVSIAKTMASDNNLISKLNADLANNHLKKDEHNMVQVEVAPTVCGPFVVTSTILTNKFKKDSRKLQGLDMEGFGLYLTSHLLDKKSLWIKGVSDYADLKKKDNYHQAAAFASARFLYYLIKEGM